MGKAAVKGLFHLILTAATFVLAAVTIGGGLNGVVGMLLAVPITATIYKLLQRDVRRRQKVTVKEENSAN